MKVGIVILNFNGSNYLYHTLDSLKRAKKNCRFAVGVIDNGSAEKDAGQAEKITKDYLNAGYEGFFIRSEKNLGFSGGNNVVMKRFLEDPEITHLCLLNSDVLVTDYWLDYLTEKDYDAAGPVTNATGNEQTVAVDYEVKLDGNAFDTVNAFSKYRHEAFSGAVFESEILYFFNTVIARRVVETIGFLDERFYPGSFEDGDYCLRMKNAGFHQYVIRDCFVHHFGSGSFSKLDMPVRVNISNVNKKRYEEKWNTKWESDSWKLLYSVEEDMASFTHKKMDERTASLIGKTLQSAETLIKNWAAGIEWFQSDGYINQMIAERQAAAQRAQSENAAQPAAAPEAAPQAEAPAAAPEEVPRQVQDACATLFRFTDISELNGKNLIYLTWQKMVRRFWQIFNQKKFEALDKKTIMLPGFQYPVVPLYMTSGRQMMGRALNLLLIKLHLKKKPEEIKLSMPAFPEEINLKEEITDVLKRPGKKIIIHAPLFTKENERDGYVQRIKRIDETIFQQYTRVYVLEDGKKDPHLKIEKIDGALYFVRYNSHDEAQRAVIFEWARLCGVQYIHSINRFMTDSVNVEMCQLLAKDDIKTIWDVHGAVPEEYAMYGSEIGCSIGNEVEKFFMQFADVIVVVNHATQKHLIQKHGATKAEFVVLPIFNAGSYRGIQLPAKPSEAGTPPTVVYCGGVQKWQNIELMQSIMEQTSNRYNYKIMVPSPADFNAYWKKGIPEHVSVMSKAPSELGEVYKDCDYGFLLRDDDVVNRVACPTKILEYISYGIVPVFKTTNIGDFVEMGIHYINYEDLLDNKLPSVKQRAEYAKENLKLFQIMEEEYRAGVEKLRGLVSSGNAQ